MSNIYFVTTLCRKNYIQKRPEPTGVQRRWRCWYHLRRGQLASPHHHLEAQGLQDPNCQRRWAGQNKNVPVLELLSHFHSPIPSHLTFLLTPSAVTLPPCQFCLPVYAFQSICHTLPHLLLLPTSMNKAMRLQQWSSFRPHRWCMNVGMIFSGLAKSGYCRYKRHLRAYWSLCFTTVVTEIIWITEFERGNFSRMNANSCH